MLYFYENKAIITQALFNALKTTAEGVNIAEMNYQQLTNGDELVTIIYDNGYRNTINVSADSGVALMRDVLRGIVL